MSLAVKRAKWNYPKCIICQRSNYDTSHVHGWRHQQPNSQVNTTAVRSNPPRSKGGEWNPNHSDADWLLFKMHKLLLLFSSSALSRSSHRSRRERPLNLFPLLLLRFFRFKSLSLCYSVYYLFNKFSCDSISPI